MLHNTSTSSTHFKFSLSKVQKLPWSRRTTQENKFNSFCSTYHTKFNYYTGNLYTFLISLLKRATINHPIVAKQVIWWYHTYLLLYLCKYLWDLHYCIYFLFTWIMNHLLWMCPILVYMSFNNALHNVFRRDVLYKKG